MWLALVLLSLLPSNSSIIFIINWVGCRRSRLFKISRDNINSIVNSPKDLELEGRHKMSNHKAHVLSVPVPPLFTLPSHPAHR